jgi:phycocyanobilin:ferredoxin oxidoreductase
MFFFASLKSESEKSDFCRVVDQYLTILIKLSKKAKPEVDEEIIQERIDFQKNYCVQQMKNEKTSMVLLKYFDKEWVNNYIKKVLFDF